MKQKKVFKFSYILLLSTLILTTSCNSQNCEELPKTFSNYDYAIKLVKSSSFKVKESINIYSSSWIKKFILFL